MQHNQIERARREKINNLIVELSKKIPDTDESSPQNSGSNTIATSNGRNGDMLSKGGILEKVIIIFMKLPNNLSMIIYHLLGM